MKIKATVTNLSDIGDHIVINCQGTASRDANWQPLRTAEIKLPVHVGRRYRIGQRIVVTITPGSKVASE